MKKVLLTLPNSIAGTLILKGYKQGFKSCGAFVMEKDARELTIDDIKRFKPDIIFGYDYGFLFNAKDEVKALLDSKNEIIICEALNTLRQIGGLDGINKQDILNKVTDENKKALIESLF